MIELKISQFDKKNLIEQEKKFEETKLRLV